RWYPYQRNITCVGTEDGSHLERQFPGVTFQRVQSGEPLPFANQSFDVVFSNAVLEHVGSDESQRRFLAELCRVGRSVFVATPNRWFPVEHHSGLPVLHYLPAPLFRRLLRLTHLKHWADEANLNILTSSSLRRLFPPSTSVDIRSVSVLGLPSNLVAF